MGIDIGAGTYDLEVERDAEYSQNAEEDGGNCHGKQGCGGGFMDSDVVFSAQKARYIAAASMTKDAGCRHLQREKRHGYG